MKILQINSVCGVTGTGRIVTNLYDAAQNRGMSASLLMENINIRTTRETEKR